MHYAVDLEIGDPKSQTTGTICIAAPSDEDAEAHARDYAAFRARNEGTQVRVTLVRKLGH